MSSPIDTALLLISRQFPALASERLLREREGERGRRGGQFLRKDELIDAEQLYSDLSKKGQREGQERAICVNGIVYTSWEGESSHLYNFT